MTVYLVMFNPCVDVHTVWGVYETEEKANIAIEEDIDRGMDREDFEIDERVVF